MDVPIGVSDRLDAKQPVLATFIDQCRHPIAQPIAIDAAVDHDVCDVNAERPVFPSHALRDHPQPRFRSGKLRKARLASQAGRRAGEDDRAAAERNQSARRLAANQKAPIAADAPKLLELLCTQIAEIDALIVARIKDDNVGRIASIAERHGSLEEMDDIFLACCVDRNRFGVTARLTNLAGDLRNLLGRPPGHEHMITLDGKAPAQCGPKPALGAHTYNDAGRAAHDKTSWSWPELKTDVWSVPCIACALPELLAKARSTSRRRDLLMAHLLLRHAASHGVAQPSSTPAPAQPCRLD